MLRHRFRHSALTRTRKTPSRWSLHFINGLLGDGWQVAGDRPPGNRYRESGVPLLAGH
jgi:hypothetical protein